MYRLIFIIIGFVLYWAPCAYSQLFIGFDGGLSSNSLQYEGYYYYDFGDYSTSTDAITTPLFGFRAEFGLQNGLRIVSGLRFAQRGGKYSSEHLYLTDGQSSIPVDFQIEYDYLEIPIGGKIFLNEDPWSFYIGLNAVAAVNIRAESIGPTDIEESVVDYSEYASDVVPFVDMLAGVDVSVGEDVNIFLEARYSQSVSGIDKEGPSSIIARSYNIVLGAMLRVIDFSNNEPQETKEATGY